MTGCWTSPAKGSEVCTDLVSGVGAGGHEVVAWFTTGRPVLGCDRIMHVWNGAQWRLASVANRDAFATAEERYAPSCGRYCSWAAARAYMAWVARRTGRSWVSVSSSTTMPLPRRPRRPTSRASLHRLMVTGRDCAKDDGDWQAKGCESTADRVCQSA